jgi:hypothetical protein
MKQVATENGFLKFYSDAINVYGSEIEVGSSPKTKERRALVVGRDRQLLKYRPSRKLLILQFMDIVLMHR